MSPNTALAAVTGVMLIPLMSSFADGAMSAVPQSLKDGALALGPTRGETMLKVVFPAAIPGIVGGVLMAESRVIGVTQPVVPSGRTGRDRRRRQGANRGSEPRCIKGLRRLFPAL
ncbi:ABC transporter permease subunit [Vannielia litorea]|uniref:ABC transporter permease subunit n=1 Tax=Vannielia litorea TaxID=1217970 RepID=UPI001FE30D10|nr:ABC transporter permease subunit [Vannielia litorea]